MDPNIFVETLRKIKNAGARSAALNWKPNDRQ
jgi:hypothetical protein